MCEDNQISLKSTSSNIPHTLDNFRDASLKSNIRAQNHEEGFLTKNLKIHTTDKSSCPNSSAIPGLHFVSEIRIFYQPESINSGGDASTIPVLKIQQFPWVSPEQRQAQGCMSSSLPPCWHSYPSYSQLYFSKTRHNPNLQGIPPIFKNLKNDFAAAAQWIRALTKHHCQQRHPHAIVPGLLRAAPGWINASVRSFLCSRTFSRGCCARWHREGGIHTRPQQQAASASCCRKRETEAHEGDRAALTSSPQSLQEPLPKALLYLRGKKSHTVHTPSGRARALPRNGCSEESLTKNHPLFFKHNALPKSKLSFLQPNSKMIWTFSASLQYLFSSTLYCLEQPPPLPQTNTMHCLRANFHFCSLIPKWFEHFQHPYSISFPTSFTVFIY